IAGPEGCGKSSLAAWFVEKGFTLIADRQVAVMDGVDLLAGYRTPFAFRASGADHLTQLADIATAPMIRAGERIYLGLKDTWSSLGEPQSCGMMIFPRHVSDLRGRV